MALSTIWFKTGTPRWHARERFLGLSLCQQVVYVAHESKTLVNPPSSERCANCQTVARTMS